MADDLSVVVLGTGRSGTSTVAGLLAQAGVWFGADLRVNARLAAKGLYEDNTLHRLNRQIAYHLDAAPCLQVETHRYRPTPALPALLAAYRDRLAALAAGRPLWGVKDPYLVVAWPEVAALYPGARLIAVHRARAAVLASFRKASGLQPATVERMVTHLQAAFYRLLDTAAGPLYHLDYGRLLADPAGQVAALLAWLGVPGLDPAAAVAFVDPALRHFDSNGAAL